MILSDRWLVMTVGAPADWRPSAPIDALVLPLDAAVPPRSPTLFAPRGILLAVWWQATMAAEAVPAALTAVEDMLARRTRWRHCPVGLLVVLDEPHADLPPCGAWTDHPGTAFHLAADQLAQAALAADHCSAETLLCPRALMAMEDCVAAAPLAGVFVAGPQTPLAPVLDAAPPRAGRYRRSTMAAAGVVAACLLAGVAGQAWMTDREQTLLQLAAEVRLPAEAVAAPAAVRALNELAALVTDDRLSSPLLPLSQTDGLARDAAAVLAARTASVLVDPVRRRLEAEQHRLEDAVAAYAAAPPRDATVEAEAFLTLLADVAEHDLYRRRAALAADGTPRAQWEAVFAWAAGTAMPLPLLDEPHGRTALARALANETARPAPLPAALVAAALPRLRQATLATGSSDALPNALDNASGILEALYRGPAGPDEMAALLDRLAAALDTVEHAAQALSAQRAALADRLRDEAVPMLTALEATGSIGPGTTKTLQTAAETALAEVATTFRTTELVGLGPILDGDGGLAPSAVAVRDALTRLRAEGFAEPVAVDPADFTTLARLDGPPDPDWVARAVRRLTAYEAWRASALPGVPQAIGAILGDYAALEAGVGAVVEVATAFQAADLGATPRATAGEVATSYAMAAPHLRAVLAALASMSGSLSQDVGWLVSVRAHRALEQLDRAYRHRPVGALAERLGAWNAAGPFRLADALPPGTPTDAAGLADLEREELRKATEAAQPLLDLLSLRAVEAAIGRPALRDIWQERATASGEDTLLQVAEYASLITERIDGFSTSRCGRLRETEAPPLFAAEYGALVTAATEKCRGLLPAVRPTRKPSPPGEEDANPVIVLPIQ